MVSLRVVLVKEAPRMDLDTTRVTLVRDILLFTVFDQLELAVQG